MRVQIRKYLVHQLLSQIESCQHVLLIQPLLELLEHQLLPIPAHNIERLLQRGVVARNDQSDLLPRVHLPIKRRARLLLTLRSRQQGRVPEYMFILPIEEAFLDEPPEVHERYAPPLVLVHQLEEPVQFGLSDFLLL